MTKKKFQPIEKSPSSIESRRGKPVDKRPRKKLARWEQLISYYESSINIEIANFRRLSRFDESRLYRIAYEAMPKMLKGFRGSCRHFLIWSRQEIRKLFVQAQIRDLKSHESVLLGMYPILKSISAQQSRYRKSSKPANAK